MTSSAQPWHSCQGGLRLAASDLWGWNFPGQGITYGNQWLPLLFVNTVLFLTDSDPDKDTIRTWRFPFLLPQPLRQRLLYLSKNIDLRTITHSPSLHHITVSQAAGSYPKQWTTMGFLWHPTSLSKSYLEIKFSDLWIRLVLLGSVCVLDNFLGLFLCNKRKDLLKLVASIYQRQMVYQCPLASLSRSYRHLGLIFLHVLILPCLNHWIFNLISRYILRNMTQSAECQTTSRIKTEYIHGI